MEAMEAFEKIWTEVQKLEKSNESYKNIHLSSLMDSIVYRLGGASVTIIDNYGKTKIEGFFVTCRRHQVPSIYDSTPWNELLYDSLCDIIEDKKIFYLNANSLAIKKIITRLEKEGCRVEKIGESCFETRNKYKIFTPEWDEQRDEKVKTRVLRVDSKNQQMEYCGLQEVGVTNTNRVAWYLQVTADIIEEEFAISSNDFLDQFKKSGDGTIGIMRIGGNQKHQNIPCSLENRLIELARKKVSNTRDHRQAIGHTYELVVLDSSLINGKNLTIKVPEEYKGLVIGKGGENIKKISQKLGIFIKVV